MKRIMVIFILILFSTGSADIVFAAEKSNVAVLDFSGKSVSQEEADIITEYFRSELTKTGIFYVMDRSNIKRILEEQVIQSSGITDVNNAVRLGRLMNVQYVFVGTYSKLDSLIMLSIEMINIETAKIEKSESRSTESSKPKDKLDLARYIAYSFMGFGVGYELFWDGSRVGFEPEWSMDQAVKNLQWNRNTYRDKKVEGYYDGKKMP